MRKMNRLRGSGPFDFFSKFNPFKKSNCEAQHPTQETPKEPQTQYQEQPEEFQEGLQQEGLHQGGRRTRTRRRKGRRTRRRSSVRQRR